MAILTKPFCFYISEAMTKRHADGSIYFSPAIVEQGEPGYYSTDYDYGADFKLAKEVVASNNARLGVDEDAALKIVASSMAASR